MSHVDECLNRAEKALIQAYDEASGIKFKIAIALHELKRGDLDAAREILEKIIKE